MAAAKRNIKTHPTGQDPDEGGFISPERTDLTMESDEAPVVMDLNAGTEEINLNEEGTGGADTTQGERVIKPVKDDAAARKPERQERQQVRTDRDTRDSRRVRERIQRERNLLNRERELREQTQRQLSEERAARVAQDERIAALERRQTDIASNADVKALEVKIQGLKDKLFAAKEAGDTRLELDLTSQLGDAQADIKVLRLKLEMAADTAKAERERRAQAGAATTNPGPSNTESSPFTEEEIAAAQDWRKANRHWFNRPSFKAAKEDATTIDGEVVGDIRAGNLDCDLYSDEHFAEVARRLRAIHPELPVVDLDGEDYDFTDEEEPEMRNERDNRGDRRDGGRQLNARGQRVNTNAGSRAPQGGIGQGGRRQRSEIELAREGKITLDQSDYNTMRTFGLNPNSAEDKKAFAKERRRTILTEHARGER